MNMPKLNPGYLAGKMFKKLCVAEAEQGTMTPYELGQFRKAYWKARCHGRLEDLTSTVKYMRTEDMKILERRVTNLYHLTLEDMYGKQGAKEFLEGIQEDKYRGEP